MFPIAVPLSADDHAEGTASVRLTKELASAPGSRLPPRLPRVLLRPI